MALVGSEVVVEKVEEVNPLPQRRKSTRLTDGFSAAVDDALDAVETPRTRKPMKAPLTAISFVPVSNRQLEKKPSIFNSQILKPTSDDFAGSNPLLTGRSK